jgi:predicted nuclease of predicted toxin-antitoxin system
MGRKGSKDEDIIIAASNRNAIIITHDADFRRIKHYKPILLEHNVGFVFFKTPKKAGG